METITVSKNKVIIGASVLVAFILGLVLGSCISSHHDRSHRYMKYGGRGYNQEYSVHRMMGVSGEALPAGNVMYMNTAQQPRMMGYVNQGTLTISTSSKKISR